MLRFHFERVQRVSYVAPNEAAAREQLATEFPADAEAFSLDDVRPTTLLEVVR